MEGVECSKACLYLHMDIVEATLPPYLQAHQLTLPLESAQGLLRARRKHFLTRRMHDLQLAPGDRKFVRHSLVAVPSHPSTFCCCLDLAELERALLILSEASKRRVHDMKHTSSPDKWREQWRWFATRNGAQQRYLVSLPEALQLSHRGLLRY
jgi:hypothetical protein